MVLHVPVFLGPQIKSGVNGFTSHIYELAATDESVEATTVRDDLYMTQLSTYKRVQSRA